jgi:hypothetical protein
MHPDSRKAEPIRRVIGVAVVTLSLVVLSIVASQSASSALPPRLDTYVTGVVKLTPEARQKLMNGEPVTKLLDGDASKEVGVFGAVWIKARIHDYVERLKDIENFERGGSFKITRRISAPPTLADFAGLHLPDEDFKDLRSCRVGECEMKLGEEALEQFHRDVDWKSPTAAANADATMRQLALRYVAGYLEGGDARLAVYRDKARPTFVAREFREMTERMPELTAYMPDLRRYLLEFPKATLSDSSSFVYWQETVFGLKPTIRVSHVVIRETPEATTVASKMLYSTHYFWTALELRALVPDASRGPGFWFVTVSRSRSDGLTGFVGTVIRGRVRREAEEGTLAALRATREALETTTAR